MYNKRNYIMLHYTNALTQDITGGKWFISYKSDGDYFTCENDTSSRTTKLKNVEDLIITWYTSRRNTADNTCIAGRGNISLLIDGKMLSESSYSSYKEIDLNTIRSYIRILKDVIEEKDSILVYPVDKAVGDYDVKDQVDEDDKVAGKHVIDNDTIYYIKLWSC